MVGLYTALNLPCLSFIIISSALCFSSSTLSCRGCGISYYSLIGDVYYFIGDVLSLCYKFVLLLPCLLLASPSHKVNDKLTCTISVPGLGHLPTLSRRQRNSRTSGVPTSRPRSGQERQVARRQLCNRSATPRATWHRLGW